MSLESRTATRRSFVKNSLAILTAIPLCQSVVGTSQAEAQALPTKPLDPATPQAQALGYVHDATKADTAKFPKRAQPGGDKQFCNNCILYQQGGVKLPNQEGEWGRCALFMDGLVSSNGWCNSWAPKPV